MEHNNPTLVRHLGLGLLATAPLVALITSERIQTWAGTVSLGVDKQQSRRGVRDLLRANFIPQSHDELSTAISGEAQNSLHIEASAVAREQRRADPDRDSIVSIASASRLVGKNSSSSRLRCLLSEADHELRPRLATVTGFFSMEAIISNRPVDLIKLR